jgi:hypothetical protein
VLHNPKKKRQAKLLQLSWLCLKPFLWAFDEHFMGIFMAILWTFQGHFHGHFMGISQVFRCKHVQAKYQ